MLFGVFEKQAISIACDFVFVFLMALHDPEDEGSYWFLNNIQVCICHDM